MHTDVPASPYTNDAESLFAAAEASILGAPWLILVGAEPDAEAPYPPEVLSNATFATLSPTERVIFLTELQGILDSLAVPEAMPDVLDGDWDGVDTPGKWEMRFGAGHRGVPMIGLAGNLELLEQRLLRHGRALVRMAPGHPTVARLCEQFADDLLYLKWLVQDVDLKASAAASAAGIDFAKTTDA